MLGNHAALVLGRQGTGKGRAGFEFACNPMIGFPQSPDSGQSRKAIGFFATTHFANEFMSVIDGARRHIIALPVREWETGWLPPASGPKSLIGQFFHTLENAIADCTIVFGGIDRRLLRKVPYDNLGQMKTISENEPPLLTRFRFGRAASPEIHEFFPKKQSDFTAKVSRTIIRH